MKFQAVVFCLSIVISLFPARAADSLRDAMQAIEENKSEQAVNLLSKAIQEQPERATAYYWRGRERFRLGRIDESLKDFDKHVELEPQAASRQWERGITCYYAGKYAEGAKQFELYQTFHDQDVENSVWRYLCVAPTDGVEKARENMLPIKHDARVPMMEIYDLFRDKKTTDDVFAAVKAGQPTAEQLKIRSFYAHLYVGLYYESLGKHELAKPHINDAATHRISHYMGDVAKIHAERLKVSETTPK